MDAEGLSQLLVPTGLIVIPLQLGQGIGRGLQGIPELEDWCVTGVTVLPGPLRYGRVIGTPAARGYLCPG